MQHEITQPIPLLDERGELTEPGYAKSLLPIYQRERVRGSLMRLKEWDYYLVMNDDLALALTVADNRYMGLDSVSLLEFGPGRQMTRSFLRPLTLGRTGLPVTSRQGSTASAGRGHALAFRVQDGRRELFARVDAFQDGQPLDAHVVLEREPEQSMVICTPFGKPGHFYFNQKINCMRAAGTVTLGSRTWTFDPARSFGTLDWGRGVWTYHNTWYWGSASGLVEGIPFGFNIGCGFGDTSAATENMLFYDGIAHKLERVDFGIPKDAAGKDDLMAPWHVTDNLGRLDLTFTPILDRAAYTGALVLESDQHQVFGRFDGVAVLDDGTALAIRGLRGFAEKVKNRW